MDAKKVWHKTLEKIKQEVSDTNFKGWFSKTEAEEITETELKILVPSAFFAEQLRVRYFDLIVQTLEEVLGKKLAIQFRVSSKFTKQPEQEEDLFSPEPAKAKAYPLNPKFTLYNFVVGLSNNVAYAAAQAVVQNPGSSYNPLFIYGGTGLGKTHLMIGIGNAVLKKEPSTKIIYCSSEKFTNDYVEAIQTRKMGEFRQRYRLADLLLVDDIQFFSGREGFQEEFFHTFNELQSKGSQMVLTSDRPPHEIAKLEDRLKSRFQGGLMIDIQPPDFDTRVAILRAKCNERGENLPEETLKLLASNLETNIRELEGRLMQIIQTLKVRNLPLSLENISSHLQGSSQRPPTYNHKQVLSVVCKFFDLTMAQLIGPKRQKELVLPRHIVMYILCEELGLTVERVGQILGGRDHTTVMHGRDRVKNLLNADREIQRVFIEVKQQLAV